MKKPSLRERLKSISIFKITAVGLRSIRNKYSLSARLKMFGGFLADYSNYKNIQKTHGNPNFDLKTEDLYPRITDKTATTPLDPIYFYQSCWCAGLIFKNKPIHHYDVASQAGMVGIISQFVPTTMIDIRPITLTLQNLSFIKGDITHLPFKDNELSSLSSICVIEHIGLGRYGDPLDPFGSEKAVAELKRVLTKNGDLYITVPIDSKNRIYFNAHRAFTREYILELFNGLALVEEKYIYGDRMTDSYDKTRGFGTGLYYFKK